MSNTRDLIQLSFGALHDWQAVNPLLMPGEMACVFDDDTGLPCDIRFGNGIARFNDLPSMSLLNSVFTKDEVTGLLQTIEQKIQENKNAAEQVEEGLSSIRLYMDEEASEDNKLTALSTVCSKIYEIIADRFGRRIKPEIGDIFTSADDLNDLSKLYYLDEQVEELHKDDTALVLIDGEEVEFTYTLESGWQKGFSFTQSELDALHSGITQERVEEYDQFKNVKDQVTTALSQVQELKEQTEEFFGNAAKKIEEGQIYYNTAAITNGGSGYTANTCCKITLDAYHTVLGYITKVSPGDGAITELVVDTTTEQANYSNCEIAPLNSDFGGSGAFCTITSETKPVDLSDLDLYLREKINVGLATKLDKGPDDGVLHFVRNGTLAPVYNSEYVRYVDYNYRGSEEGIETAPFRTINAALASVSDKTEPVCLMLAAGKHTSANITLDGTVSKRLILGYSSGANRMTSLGSIAFRGATEIGVRDLEVTDYVSIEGGNNIEFDNVTFKNINYIAPVANGVVRFTHCTFKGSVVVGYAPFNNITVYFDCCDFSECGTFSINQNAVVINEGCYKATPSVGDGASYFHISGSLFKRGNNALSASSSAYVGLYSGVALDKANALAPILLQSVQKYSLGAFVYDKANSNINNSTRIEKDGLDGEQVYVARPLDGGYTPEQDNVKSHLKAISSELYNLKINGGGSSGGGGSGSTTGNVTRAAFSKSGTQITLTLDRELDSSLTATINDFTSTAFTDPTEFATKQQGQLAESAYQKPRTGIPENDLDDATKQKIDGAIQSSERLSTFNRNSELNDTKIYNAKSIQKLLKRIPDSATSDSTEGTSDLVTASFLTKKLDEVKEETSSRILTPNKTGYGTDQDFFAAFSVLSKAGTKFYTNGTEYTKDTLKNGDRAKYFSWYVVPEDESVAVKFTGDGSPETARPEGATEGDYYYDYVAKKVYQYSSSNWTEKAQIRTESRRCTARYDGTNWYLETEESQIANLEPDQQAALNSKITGQLVEYLDGTKGGNSITRFEDGIASELLKRPELASGVASGDVLTGSGQEGKLGTARKVATTLSGDVYSGNDTDLATAKSIVNYVVTKDTAQTRALSAETSARGTAIDAAKKELQKSIDTLSSTVTSNNNTQSGAVNKKQDKLVAKQGGFYAVGFPLQGRSEGAGTANEVAIAIGDNDIPYTGSTPTQPSLSTGFTTLKLASTYSVSKAISNLYTTVASVIGGKQEKITAGDGLLYKSNDEFSTRSVVGTAALESNKTNDDNIPSVRAVVDYVTSEISTQETTNETTYVKKSEYSAKVSELASADSAATSQISELDGRVTKVESAQSTLEASVDEKIKKAVNPETPSDNGVIAVFDNSTVKPSTMSTVGLLKSVSLSAFDGEKETGDKTAEVTSNTIYTGASGNSSKYRLKLSGSDEVTSPSICYNVCTNCNTMLKGYTKRTYFFSDSTFHLDLSGGESNAGNTDKLSAVFVNSTVWITGDKNPQPAVLVFIGCQVYGNLTAASQTECPKIRLQGSTFSYTGGSTFSGGDGSAYCSIDSFSDTTAEELANSAFPNGLLTSAGAISFVRTGACGDLKYLGITSSTENIVVFGSTGTELGTNEATLPMFYKSGSGYYTNCTPSSLTGAEFSTAAGTGSSNVEINSSNSSSVIVELNLGTSKPTFKLTKVPAAYYANTAGSADTAGRATTAGSADSATSATKITIGSAACSIAENTSITWGN